MKSIYIELLRDHSLLFVYYVNFFINLLVIGSFGVVIAPVTENLIVGFENISMILFEIKSLNVYAVLV